MTNNHHIRTHATPGQDYRVNASCEYNIKYNSHKYEYQNAKKNNNNNKKQNDNNNKKN